MALSLADLNAMDQAGFGQALGRIFEHSVWIPIAAHAARPFHSTAELHAAMVNVVAQSGPDKQLALLRAHPMLAARGELTQASQDEQGGMGLDKLEVTEAKAFEALNAEYQERFGFPFIIAVRLNDKTSILAAMQARLNNDQAAEVAEAITQIGLISKLRMQDAVTG